MPKRTLFTNITPLPAHVSREVAIAMLHNHDEMIELNPLVIEHHPIQTPRDAPADEFLDCVWQEMTDRVSYLPGLHGKVTYRACFHDIPNGLQTHIYAPLGLDIREKWSIGGALPGEPPEARQIGIDLPTSGLYLREDCDMKSNRMTTSFVRKNLDNSHKVLVERIVKKAERVEQMIKADPTSPGASMLQHGSHMARSNIAQTINPGIPASSPSDDPRMMSIHPAYRNGEDNRLSIGSGNLPAYSPSTVGRNSQHGSDTKSSISTPGAPAKQFMAELPGSTHFPDQSDVQSQPSQSSGVERYSYVSELAGSDIGTTSPDGTRRFSFQEASRPSDTESRHSELPGEMNRLNVNGSSNNPSTTPAPALGKGQNFRYGPADYASYQPKITPSQYRT